MKSEQTPTEDGFFVELGEMLQTYEGPGHVRRRPRPARRRIRALPVALAAAVVCATAGSIIALNVTERGASRPPATASRGIPAPAPLSLDDMITSATAVFVGRVTDIGENSIVPGGGLGVCPVHYQVERVYRGELGATADLGGFCGNEFPTEVGKRSNDWMYTFLAEIGKSYLVFAGWWELGSGSRILAPAGREQGIYPLTGADTAANEENGAVRLDTLEERLALPSAASSSQALRHVELPPLALGPSVISAGQAASASTEYVPLEQAIEKAEVVFVGRVVAIGPKKYVTEPSALDPSGMVMYPVRYRVERVLRGDPVDTIDLGDWTNEEDGSSSIGESVNGLFPAEVGKRYLVFAYRTQLGERRVSSLIPEGYFQNIYLITGDDTAKNELNGTVHLDELERRLAEAVPSSN